MLDPLQASQVSPYVSQPQLNQSISYFPQTTQTSVSQILPGTSYTAPVTQSSQIYSLGPQLSQAYSPTTQLSQVYGSPRIFKPSPPYEAFIPPTPVPRYFGRLY